MAVTVTGLCTVQYPFSSATVPTNVTQQYSVCIMGLHYRHVLSTLNLLDVK
jgi:hypothetical protein